MDLQPADVDSSALPAERGRRFRLPWTGVGRWSFRVVLGAFVVAIVASYGIPAWYRLHDERLLIVTSGSMAPYFRAGDAVVMHRLQDPSQLRVGQVVSFWPLRGTRMVTHRIIGLVSIEQTGQDVASGQATPITDPVTGKTLKRPFIRTKGDAVATPDPDSTPVAQVRGVVREVKPGWGRWLGWAHAPEGRLALFAPPLLLLAGAELLAMWQGRGRIGRHTGES
jgi:signal peptidase